MTLLQPPSGGCVLKLCQIKLLLVLSWTAAFGRLCVETIKWIKGHGDNITAAFGRLCVETIKQKISYVMLLQPPSGGCVLKL